MSDRSVGGSATPVAGDVELLPDEYGRVANSPRGEEDFSQFEAVIRRDERVKAHRGRIEFGSVKMEGSSAIVEVLFFSRNGGLMPYTFTLVPKNKSWKIDKVQRIWFQPRSHLLRGLRV